MRFWFGYLKRQPWHEHLWSVNEMETRRYWWRRSKVITSKPRARSHIVCLKKKKKYKSSLFSCSCPPFILIEQKVMQHSLSGQSRVWLHNIWWKDDMIILLHSPRENTLCNFAQLFFCNVQRILMCQSFHLTTTDVLETIQRIKMKCQVQFDAEQLQTFLSLPQSLVFIWSFVKLSHGQFSEKGRVPSARW